jgi:beta-glucosidase
LGPAESRRVEFTLSPRDLSEVNEKSDRVVASGNYRIYIGGGQPGTSAPGVEAAFHVKGQQKLPE